MRGNLRPSKEGLRLDVISTPIRKELATIKVSKIAIAEGDHEEFIIRAHTDYLAATIPGAKRIILPNVSHFAPWQDPTTFNNSILQFLRN